jgi:hypothetical protein
LIVSSSPRLMKGRMSAVQRTIRILLVLGLAVFSLPIEAGALGETSLEETACCNEAAACCERDAPNDCPEIDHPENDDPENDDCCPDGCTRCFLSCCVASLCTLPGSVSSNTADMTRGSTAFDPSTVPAIDPERIDHPPRR